MFKIRNLLKNLLGLGNWLTAGIVEGGGGGELSQDQAAEAFGDFFEQGVAETTNAAPKDEEQAEPAAEEAASEEAEPQEGEAEEVAAEPEKFSIEVDGKQVELTAAEISEAVKSKWQQADYTQKTMALAEERKAATAEKEKARTERDNYAQQLGQFTTTEQAILQEAAAQLTDELLDADPVEYMKLQRTLQNRHAKLQQAHQALQQIEQQRHAEAEQTAREFHAQQLETVQAKLPAWKDPAVMKKEVGEIKGYLFSQGFEEADLSSMQNHKFVLLARAAMQHAQLMDKAKEATKKIAAVPSKVARPGVATAQKPDGRSSAMRSLAKTGSREAAAQAFTEWLG